MPNYLPVFTSPQGEAETLRAYQQVLDRWEASFTELDIPTSFGQTHVIASGPEGGRPLVLLHALFATATAWYRTAGELSRQYRVYAVDVIGEANRSRPTRPIKSMDEFLGWFTEVIDGLGISELYLAGNSYGGFTAAYYAMHLPGRVRKLALIGPAATIHGMPPFYLHMFLPKAMYLMLPWLPGKERVARHSVSWMHAGLPADPAWAELFRLEMVNGLLLNQVFPRVYTAEELAKIQAPTLLVLGDHEKIYSPHKACEQASRLMPSIQVEIIPGGHHVTAIAQPERVSECLLRFFGEAPRAEGAALARARA